MGYFLADGIYPKLTTIVQDFSQTLDIPDYVRFNKYQMDKIKDVERAFGVLRGISINAPKLRNDLVKHIDARPSRGGHAANLSSLEGSDMEYVVLPSSEGDYDDTDLEEEVVPDQNEDGVFDYYGDYNDQIPYDFEHAVEHVYGDGHMGDGYEHDGDDDEDYGDEEDYDDDHKEDDDDEDSDCDGDVAYNDAGMYDDDVEE
ncbi:ciliogenesis-associated TTC17-interacting protein-like [Papaver somniferum]|uniref:ciliogenesis-associated TTC17-interacting protein-like n=1 Tax=Papaver somniferum TaxID=3469 RepID=UPI000E6F9F98|nr:ciliogenesis-associated TTC17-interacting protein-like [Papaver somniferum]